MAKKKDVIDVVSEPELKDQKIRIWQIKLEAVSKLEEASKVGFFTQGCEILDEDNKPLNLEPLVRLCCETPDEPQILTPWCSVQVLSNMIMGALSLYPVLINTIKDHQKNAQAPEE